MTGLDWDREEGERRTSAHALHATRWTDRFPPRAGALRAPGKVVTVSGMRLGERADGWWEIVRGDDVLSTWPDRETACNIARLYGWDLD